VNSKKPGVDKPRHTYAQISPTKNGVKSTITSNILTSCVFCGLLLTHICHSLAQNGLNFERTEVV